MNFYVEVVMGKCLDNEHLHSLNNTFKYINPNKENSRRWTILHKHKKSSTYLLHHHFTNLYIAVHHIYRCVRVCAHIYLGTGTILIILAADQIIFKLQLYNEYGIKVHTPGRSRDPSTSMHA